MTFAAFVEKCQLARGSISEIERGLAVPSIATLDKIATCLGVGMGDLLAGLGESGRHGTIPLAGTPAWDTHPETLTQCIDPEVDKHIPPAINADRGAVFLIRPSNPKVVVTCITDATHPLYDRRVLLPAPAALVASIKRRGQEVPAEGYRVAGLDVQGRQVVELTKGRLRWRAMQQVWEEQRAEGRPEQELLPFKVIVKQYKGDWDKFEASITDNAHRVADSPMDVARKLSTYLQMARATGVTAAQERAKMIFNIESEAALDQLLALLMLSPQLQEQVERGELAPAQAIETAKVATA